MQIGKWNRLAIATVAAVSVAVAGTPLADATTTTTTTAPDRTGGVTVQDVRIPVAGQEDVAAWLVRPARAHRRSAAGILWLHWLGEIHGDRSEYLAEAIELAD